MKTILITPDKFKGTLSGREFCAIVEQIAEDLGFHPISIPLADGGDGTLQAFGGANRSSVVTGPDGKEVRAEWRLDEGRAVIETAICSGLVLAGGAEKNDPINATSRGSGELIVEAVKAGAKSIIVGIGGSAMTDGGLGALEAIREAGGPFEGVEILVACDVQTRFVDAAKVFAPQKGANEKDVLVLTRRLEDLRAQYFEDFGIDVHETKGSGAAGGLGGALLALGAKFSPGFDLVAKYSGFFDVLGRADVIVTGEGKLDRTSLSGKVVGEVINHGKAQSIPVIIICGQAEKNIVLPPNTLLLSLADESSVGKAMNDPATLIKEHLPTILSNYL